MGKGLILVHGEWFMVKGSWQLRVNGSRLMIHG